MKQLKKTLLTLVALLAVTTGAWADDYFYLVVDGTTATLKYGDKGENPYFKDGFVPLWKTSTDVNLDIKGFTTITVDASCQNLTNLTSLPPVFQNFTALTVINNLENINTTSITRMAGLFYGCSSLQTLDLSDWNTASVTNMMNMFKGCLSLETIYVGEGWSTEKVTTSLYMFTGCTKLPNFDESKVDKTNAYAGGYLKAKPGTVLPTPNVNEWSLTQPAGNVTVSVEYFPQAALTEAPTAINDVPATTDGAIVKAGTVANIGSSTTAQGTVMYYASQTALDDDALLALAADQWKADVPTAESLAEGQAYVYYYVRGNDSDTDEENFSDGDINALTINIAAEPTYAVTFADGVNPEPPADPEWTADPNTGVKKGQTVTVTYTGDRKVIGVKAEKKASTPTLKDALADGATVVINCVWDGETTFTYTNNGGNYTGNTTGFYAPSFTNGMSKDGTTLKFTASNQDLPQANVSIDFFTDSNEYYFNSKGDAFDSFTISVNGSDITSQLTEVK